MDLVKQAGVPVAQVYTCKREDHEDHHDVVILEKLKGTRLDTLWDSLTKKEKIQITEKIGKLMKKIHHLFLLILVIASILRLYQLGHVPVSLDWDEVSLGYNAYSILKTGKDEFGQQLPLILRSFDDYKPALYAYLLIPFIFIFGLS